MTRFRKQRRKIGVAIGAMLAAGAIGCAAYFGATLFGTSTTHITTSGPTQYTVAVNIGALTGGPLAPDGTSTETQTLAINWVGGTPIAGTAPINSVTAVVVNDGSGNIIDDTTGNPVVGCLSSWFTATVSGLVLPDTPNMDNGLITYTMPVNNSIDQSVCQNHAPRVKVVATT